MMFSSEVLEIILGYKTVEIGDVLYDIYFPSFQVLHDASFYARKAKKELQGKAFDGIDIETMKDTLLSDGEIKLLDSFDLTMAEYKRDLEIQTNAGKRQIIRNRIKKWEEDREKVEVKWSRIKLMTLEGYQYLITTQFCFSNCVRFHETGEFVWASYEEFLDDSRGILIQSLLREYVDLTTKYSDKELRNIAKDGYNRILFQLLKENLIPICSSFQEMNMIRLRLEYWITYYTNIIQNAQEECPSEILEDDSQFDTWADRVRKGITPDIESTSQGKYKVKGKHRETIVINQ